MAEILYKQNSLRANLAPRLAWRTPAAVVAGTGLVALCAHISLPLGFTPVPLTMQTFGVLLVGLLLSPGAAFASMSLYLMEGAAGLPVFSPHHAALSVFVLFGPTGGYLLSYPFAAMLASTVYRYARRGILASFMATCLASILILVVGASWLSILSRAPFSVVAAEAITPFLAGDALKAAAAAMCASTFNSIRRSPQN